MPQYDLDRGIARENLSRLLAACYYQPGPEFAEEKVFDSMLEAATRLHPELAAHARRLGEDYAAEGYQALLLDYTRLFLGPNHIIAKPYGSVWLEGGNTVMGESTMAVQALYQEGGFDMSEECREVPDHVAVELEFLYLLIYRENEAHRDGKPEVLEAKTALRKRFLDEHLGRWVGPFTAAMRAGAQTGFYRQLADITVGFVGLQAVKAQGS
ncbi:MAG: molecular chaperone TorD family protein [Betaproteobacteria bacterium]|nr:molecular chaperone TorD family protein [Betaproteobacteria bacterium]